MAHGGVVIEAVTFDFWETLARDTPENLARARDRRIAGLQQALRRAGFDRPRAALEAAHDATGAWLADLFRRGQDAPTRQQVRVLLEHLEAGLAAAVAPEAWAALEEAYATAALAFPPAIREGSAQVLRALRDRRIRIGLISNTGRTPGRVLRLILQRAGLLEHFEALTFSDEAGIRKPDPRIFRWTLNKLGARAERAAHVGDDLGADIGGAQAAGMRGVHVVNGLPPPAQDPGGGGDGPVIPDAAVGSFAELIPALEGLGLPAGR